MFRYFKPIFHSAGYIGYSYLSWMHKYAKHPEKYPLKVRYNKIRKLLRNISNGFSVDYHVFGMENLPNETCYIVANHLSSFDPLALISIIENPSTFVAKKEVLKMPFIGTAVKDIEGKFIDRKDLKQSLKVMLKVEEDLHKKEKNWIIFPEGTRNKDPLMNIKDFHHGTFRPAYRSKTPIVPVCLYGTFRVFKTKPSYKKYPVFISFLKPLYPSEYEHMTTNEIAKYCHDEIQKELNYKIRALDNEEMLKLKKK